ncbi:hypothetical protein IFM89_034735, partial [Coptis chinensis]
MKIQGLGNVYYQERVMPQMYYTYTKAKEPNLSFNRKVIRPASAECKLGGPQMQPVIPAEVVEWPKIKLLPRSEPLDTLEPPIVDYKQGHRLPSNPCHVEIVIELHASETSAKPGSTGSDKGKQAVENPRLNLKPWSQPLEQFKGIAERERLFNFKKDRDGYWKWFAGNVASGGAAGASSLLFVYPLDYARTHPVNDTKAAKKGGERQFNGLIDVLQEDPQIRWHCRTLLWVWHLLYWDYHVP